MRRTEAIARLIAPRSRFVAERIAREARVVKISTTFMRVRFEA
jgi:hypothetical protein